MPENRWGDFRRLQRAIRQQLDSLMQLKALSVALSSLPATQVTVQTLSAQHPAHEIVSTIASCLAVFTARRL